MSNNGKAGIIAGVIAGAVALGVGAALFALERARDRSSEESPHGDVAHSHSHSHGHGHAHASCSGTGGQQGHAHGHDRPPMSFADAQGWASKFDTPERDAWQQPDRIVNEVIAPLLLHFGDLLSPTSAGADEPVVGPRSPLLSAERVVADVGAGTGYLTVRLARNLPAATVIATDPEDGMRQFLTARCVKLYS